MDRLSTWEILMCDHSLLSLFKMKGVYVLTTVVVIVIVYLIIKCLMTR